MKSDNLEFILSKQKESKSLEKAYSAVKNHEKSFKLGFSAGFALPEVFSVLAFERYSKIIPNYEYNFAYVQHAAVTLPFIYVIAVAATYLDASMTMHYLKKAYGLVKNRKNYSSL